MLKTTHPIYIFRVYYEHVARLALHLKALSTLHLKINQNLWLKIEEE